MTASYPQAEKPEQLKPSPSSPLSRALAMTYNPVATHGFCFLLGITAMAYSWPDREQAHTPKSFKKGQVYLWLNPKRLTLPDPILPIPYIIAKKLPSADICAIADATVRLSPSSKAVRIHFAHSKKTEPLVTALRKKQPLVALPADHPIAVDPCNASVLRIEYGS